MSGEPCCTDQGCGRNDPDPVLGSCDAGGLRESQLQHAVQDRDADVHLSRPTLVRTRAQPVPDHALEPADGGLAPGARIVARGLLPAHPALLGDEVQVAVPLRRRGLGRGAGHGGRARRNDDVRARVALGHVGVNALLVVRAVRRDGGDRVRDWVQQGADLGGVVLVAVGQGGGHDPAGLGVHAEMELPPRPAPLGAVLLDQPLARAVELQPRAVDQQVHGAGIAASAAIRTVAARLRPRHLQRLGPAAQGPATSIGPRVPPVGSLQQRAVRPRLVPNTGTSYVLLMRIIARSTLVAFGGRHPETKALLARWFETTKAAHWGSMDELQRAFPKAKVLNAERVRFEVAGGNYRLVVAFDFVRQIAFIKFIGTHAEYDRIDALTVSHF